MTPSNPDPGYARAALHEIEVALDAAAAAVSSKWALERSVPPFLLWQDTLAAARKLALKALTLDDAFQSGTRSWTELGFGSGEDDGSVSVDLLWRPTAQVVIAGVNVRIRGSIDRSDFNSSRNGVRVSDYKTGVQPPKANEIVLGGGAELQRVLYALASRQLLPDNPRVIARLVYLGDDQPRPYRLEDVDQAIADISEHVSAAIDLLRRGITLPGPMLARIGTTSGWRCRRPRRPISKSSRRRWLAHSAIWLLSGPAPRQRQLRVLLSKPSPPPSSAGQARGPRGAGRSRAQGVGGGKAADAL